LLGGIIVISVYFATRPEFIEVAETTAEESLPSLIKVAPLGEGAILMEYTESLEDPTKLFYYVTVQDLDFESLPNVSHLEDMNLSILQEPRIRQSATLVTIQFRCKMSHKPSFLTGCHLVVSLVTSMECCFWKRGRMRHASQLSLPILIHVGQLRVLYHGHTGYQSAYP
jgi:hypothetical protein